MSLVLDCSAALAWCFEDEQTPAVKDLLERVVMGGAVVLSDRFRLTTYDAAHPKLATRRHLPLASLDQPLRNAASAMSVPLVGTTA